MWKIYCTNSELSGRVNKRGTFTDQKYLRITSLHTDYLNLDISWGSGRNNERSNLVKTKWNVFESANHSAEECFKRIRKDKEKACADGDLDK